MSNWKERRKYIPQELWRYEKAVYELPQNVMLTKAGGLWLAIVESAPHFSVWQEPKEDFITFINRVNNEIRQIHA